MNNVHTIPNPRRELSEALAEQPCYRDPARRAALHMVQRMLDDGGWHHSNANAVDFMRGFSRIARKLARSKQVHSSLRSRLKVIADFACE